MLVLFIQREHQFRFGCWNSNFEHQVYLLNLIYGNNDEGIKYTGYVLKTSKYR